MKEYDEYSNVGENNKNQDNNLIKEEPKKRGKGRV